MRKVIYVPGRILGIDQRVSLDTASKPDPNLFRETDLLLIDYDLGLSDRNGLDVAENFKANNAKGFVCLHTNRTDAKVFKTALEAGCDAVYTKPITAEHLTKLLLETAASSEQTEQQKRIPSRGPSLRVAFVDDSLTLRLSWKRVSPILS